MDTSWNTTSKDLLVGFGVLAEKWPMVTGHNGILTTVCNANTIKETRRKGCLSNINFQIMSLKEAPSPFVEFKWKSLGTDKNDLKAIMDNSVIYAVITIVKKNYPKKIEIP